MTGNIKWWQRLFSMALVVFMLFGSVPNAAVAYAADVVANNASSEQSVEAQPADTSTEAPTAEPSATAEPTAEPTAAAETPAEPTATAEEATPAPSATAQASASPAPTVMNAAEITGSSSYGGVTVNVVAPVGAFPEGTTLQITPIEAQQDQATVSEAVTDVLAEGDQLNSAVAFDITFLYNGVEVQPADGSTVDVSFVLPDEMKQADDVQVYHVEDVANAEQTIQTVDSTAQAGGDVTVAAESFSIYVVGAISKTNADIEVKNNGVYSVLLSKDSIKLQDKAASYSPYWTVGNTDVASFSNNRSTATGLQVTLDLWQTGTTTVSARYWNGTSSSYVTDTFTLKVTDGTVTITDALESEGKLKVDTDLTEEDVTYTWTQVKDGVSSTYTHADNPAFVDADGTLDVATLLGGQTEYDSVYYTVTVHSGTTELVSASYNVPYFNVLKNGSFESPNNTTNSINAQMANGTSGLIWLTTGVGTGWMTGHDVEIVNRTTNSKQGVADAFHIPVGLSDTAAIPQGKQCAELNCEAAGALYQDVLTDPGSTLNWSLYHRARGSSTPSATAESASTQYDTMYVVIADVRAVKNITTQDQLERSILSAARSQIGSSTGVNPHTTVQVNGYTVNVWKVTDRQQWTLHKDSVQTAANQYVTRFFFAAGSTAAREIASGSNTIGNLLDDVKFTSETIGTFQYVVDGNLYAQETKTGSVNTSVALTQATLTDLMQKYTLVGVQNQDLGGSIWTSGTTVPTTMLLKAAGENVQIYYFTSGGLNITKAVQGSAAPDSQLYTIYVRPANMGTAGSAYYIDGTKLTNTATVNGESYFAVTLKKNQTVKITGLANGETYKIREEKDSTGVTELTGISGNSSTGSYEGGVYTATMGTGAAAVTVTNTCKQADLTVTKLVTGLDASAVATLKTAMQITVTDQTEPTAAVRSVSLDQMEETIDATTGAYSYTYTFTGIPTHSYTVAETGTAMTGYTLSGTATANVTVDYNGATAALTNNYMRDTANGDVTAKATKTWTGGQAPSGDWSVTMKLYKTVNGVQTPVQGKEIVVTNNTAVGTTKYNAINAEVTVNSDHSFSVVFRCLDRDGDYSIQESGLVGSVQASGQSQASVVSISGVSDVTTINSQTVFNMNGRFVLFSKTSAIKSLTVAGGSAIDLTPYSFILLIPSSVTQTTLNAIRSVLFNANGSSLPNIFGIMTESNLLVLQVPNTNGTTLSFSGNGNKATTATYANDTLTFATTDIWQQLLYTSYSAEYANTFTNTATTSVNVTKVWKADSLANKPSVTVELLQNGTATGTTLTLTGTTLTGTFSNLPKYDANGTAYTYTVREQGTNNNTVTIGGNTFAVAIAGDQAAGYTITNTLTGTETIYVEKVWNTDGDASAPLPDSITLYISDTLSATLAKQSGNTWKGSITDVPMYDANGSRISYSITAEQIGSGNKAAGATMQYSVNGRSYIYAVTKAEGRDGSTEAKALQVTNTLLTNTAFVLYKVDKATQQALAGATFSIYNASALDTASNTIRADAAAIKTVTSDANGAAMVEGLSVGTYYIQETAAPQGYDLDGTLYKVVVAEQNDNGSNIKAYKVGSSNLLNWLSQTFADASGSSKVQSFVIKFEDARREGKVTIAKNVTGTIGSDGSYTFTLSAKKNGVDYTIPAQDLAFSDLTGSLSGNALTLGAGKNVVITLPDGVTLTAVENDASAKYTNYALTAGVTASGSAAVSNGKGSFTAAKDSVGTITFNNQYDRQTAKLTVTKTFSGVDSLDSMFTLTVTGKDGNTIVDAARTLTLSSADKGSPVSNADGSKTYTWTIANAKVGAVYTATEQNAQLGNAQLTATNVGDASATCVLGGTAVLAVTNTYQPVQGSFSFAKKDAQTDGAISGVSFTLTDASGKQTTAVSDVNGVVTFTGLAVGSYTLTEAKRDGYAANNNQYTVTVEAVKTDGIVSSTTATVSVSGSGYTDGVITNTAETRNITIAKQWDDAHNQDGKRPSSIALTLTGVAGSTTVVNETVTLNADGTATFTKANTVYSITVNAASAAENTGETPAKWQCTVNGLPKAYNGTDVVYTLSETQPAEYTTAAGSVTLGADAADAVLTNTHTPETKDIAVSKVWVNDNGSHPASVTFVLKGMANSKEVSSHTLVISATGATMDGKTVAANTFAASTDGNTWNYTVAGLPKYSAGSEITYTVTETQTEAEKNQYAASYSNGGLTVTNTKLNGAFTILKLDDAGMPLAGATFQLYKDSRATVVVGQTLTSDANGVVTVPAGMLTAGSVYYLRETASPNNEVYIANDTTWKLTVPAGGQVTAGDITVETQPQTLFAKFVSLFTGTDAAKTAALQVVNARRTGTIEITKEAVLNGRAAQNYTFTVDNPAYVTAVTFSDTSASYSKGTITMPAGCKATLTVLIGHAVSVTETTTEPANSNYTLAITTKDLNNMTAADSKVSTAGVTENQTVGATFVNTYTRKTANLVVTKTVSGDLKTLDAVRGKQADNAAKLAITLTSSENDQIVLDAAKAAVSTDGAQNTTYTWTITDAKVGATYTAAETNAFVEGYTWSGTNSAVSTKVAKDEVQTLALSNVYTQIKGGFSIDKREGSATGTQLSGVTFRLYSDEALKNMVTSAVTANGTASFSNLALGTYYMKEDAVTGYTANETVYKVVISAADANHDGNQDGFAVAVTAGANGNLVDANRVLTVVNVPAQRSITVSKVWNDDNNRDNLRSDVTVTLQQSVGGGTWQDVGGSTGTAVLAYNSTSKSSRTATFSNLPAMQNGQKIEYRVVETGISGYTTEYSTNGTNFGADSNVVSLESADQSITVKNTHDIATASVHVVKTWKDSGLVANQDGLRTASVEVSLQREENGTWETVGEAVNLSASNGWLHIWQNLPVNNNGSAYSYKVVETAVSGYTTTYRVSSGSPDGFQLTANTQTNVTVTNTHTPDTSVGFTLSKVWADESNRYNSRPSEVVLTVNGTANGNNVYTKDYTLSAATDADKTSADSWELNVSGLPKYYGKDTQGNTIEIAYTVAEKTDLSQRGYTSAVQGTTVTNTYNAQKAAVKVTKYWDDASNQDGYRPTSITISLQGYKQDGTTSLGSNYAAAVTLTAANALAGANDTKDTNTWSADSIELPAVYTDDSGAQQRVVYKATEPAVVQYTSSATEVNVQNGAATFTNTHTPETTSVKVEKTWSLNGEVQPAAVSVQLFANGIAQGDAFELNAANGWSNTWTGLAKKAAGAEITYTVKEITGTDSNGAPQYGTEMQLNGITYAVANGTRAAAEGETAQHIVTISNTVSSDGALLITKNVLGTTAATPDRSFTIQVSLKDAAGNAISGSFPVSVNGADAAAQTFTNGTASFDLPVDNTDAQTDSGTIRITGLPTGAFYTVAEAIDGQTMTVNSAKNGYTLTAQSTSGNTIAAASTSTLTNRYDLQNVTGAAITAGKELTGRKFIAGDSYDTFPVTLQEIDANGATAENGYSTAANVDKTNASYTLQLPTYTAAGTHYYKVTENQPAQNDNRNVAYSTAVYYVATVVTDNGTGGLVAQNYSAALANGTITAGAELAADSSIGSFTNDYAASTTLDLSQYVTVTKTLANRELLAGEFSFTLQDENGNTIATVQNDANGNVVLPTLTYTSAEAFTASNTRTYTYTLSEVGSGDVTLDNDSAVYTLTVNVGINADTGAMTANLASVTVKRSADAQASALAKTNDKYSADFANVYNGEGSAVITVTKSVVTTGGVAYPVGDNLFSFDLYEVGSDGTASKISNAAVVNNAATFTVTKKATGTYHYYVQENAAVPTGYTADTAKHYVDVTFSYNQADKAKLSSAVVYYGADGKTAIDALTVVNTFDTSRANTSAQLKAEKLLNGGDSAVAENQFTFDAKLISVGDGTTNGTHTLTTGEQAASSFAGVPTALQAGNAAAANGAADVAFNVIPLSFDDNLVQAGSYVGSTRVYTYQITEQAASSDGKSAFYGFDSTVYTAVVTLTDNGDGTLTANTAYYTADGEPLADAAVPSFQNTYITTSLAVTKQWDDLNNVVGARPDTLTVTVKAYAGTVDVTDQLIKAGIFTDADEGTSNYTYQLTNADKKATTWSMPAITGLPTLYYGADAANGTELTYTVSDSVKDYTMILTGSPAQEIAAEKTRDGYLTAKITNRANTGSLTITKVIDGASYQAEEDFLFAIYYETPAADNTAAGEALVATQALHWSPDGENTITVSGLPYGSYRVEEMDSGSAIRYKTESVVPEYGIVTISQSTEPVAVTVTNKLTSTEYQTYTSSTVNTYNGETNQWTPAVGSDINGSDDLGADRDMSGDSTYSVDINLKSLSDHHENLKAELDAQEDAGGTSNEDNT